MRVIFVLTLFFCSIQFIHAQAIKLVNAEKPNKVRILNRFDYMEIALKEEKSENRSVTRNYAGFLNGCENGKMVIDADYEYTDELVFNPYSSVITTKELYEDTLYLKSFFSDEIDYIIHQKKFGTICGNIGVACIYGVIIAPVFAIDYKKGEIHSDNYFILAGGLLTTAIISYSLSFTFGEKKFYITPNFERKPKKTWNLAVD